MNNNVKQAIRVVTIAGSAVLVLNSAMSLIKAGSSMDLKGAIMPAVSILVGVSAFNYALQDKVTLKRG
jgi:hypothetical protein